VEACPVNSNLQSNIFAAVVRGKLDGSRGQSEEQSSPASQQKSPHVEEEGGQSLGQLQEVSGKVTLPLDSHIPFLLQVGRYLEGKSSRGTENQETDKKMVPEIQLAKRPKPQVSHIAVYQGLANNSCRGGFVRNLR